MATETPRSLFRDYTTELCIQKGGTRLGPNISRRAHTGQGAGQPKRGRFAQDNADAETIIMGRLCPDKGVGVVTQ